jgi:predicted ATPase/DNA-binding SARP family transcriptional activator
MDRLSIHLFGFPRLLIDGTRVALNRRKGLALLAYLAVTGRPQSRDMLSTLFWPDQDRVRARAALRKTLFILNRSLGYKWLNVSREAVGLSDTAPVYIDVVHFKETIHRAALHEHVETTICPDCLALLLEAEALYTGDFLAGFTLSDSVAFDDWQQTETDRLHRDMVTILNQLVDYYQAAGEWERAIAAAKRWADLNPLDEQVHRRLMILYGQNQQLAAAAAQYETCRRILADEIGVDPAPETRQIFSRLFAGEAKLPDLPPQLTAFIGREEERRRVKHLLAQPHHRLITLMGPGGIGKTRLSLAVVPDLSQLFADGIIFVPLAALDSAALLLPRLANALNLSLEGQTPEQELLHFLANKQLLLILDSFEQLLDGVPLLLEILAAAPDVKLLITSRQRLNLRGESVIDLAGLAYPADANPDAPLDSYSGLRLFLACAERIRTDYQFTADEQRAAVRLCQLVDGSPLGIELAATWLRLLSCAEVVEEVMRSLAFLTTTMHDIPERHRSMRAVINSSWNLLPPAEREALEKLSVFRGGFSREAAVQVAGASLFTLSSLLDKSLLRRAANGRYELHELVRQFAAAKLQTDAENEQRLSLSHCQHFAHFLEGQQMQLLGHGQRKALAAIKVEMDNIRQAWRYAVDNELLAEIIQMHVSLFLVHESQSWFGPGEALFGYARKQLAAGGHHDHPLREQVLGIAYHFEGVFCQRLGLYAQARKLLNRALSLLRRADGPDIYSLPACLYDLGLVAYVQGNYLEAQQYFEETLSIFEQHASHWGSQWMINHVLNSLGSVALVLGDYEQAERLGQDCLKRRKEAGDARGVALSLNFLGSLFYRLGRHSQAQQYCQQSLDMARKIDSRRGIAKALHTLGQIAQEESNHEAAQRYYEQSLALFREIGDRRRIAYTLGDLSYLFLLAGQREVALDLAQEALQLAKETEALPALLKVMADVVPLLDYFQQTGLGVRVATALLHHPAGGRLTKDKAARRLLVMGDQGASTEVSAEPIDMLVAEIQQLFSTR